MSYREGSLPDATAASQEGRAEEAFKRHLLQTGLVSQLPATPEAADEDDVPVVVAGEPISETVIRERR